MNYGPTLSTPLLGSDRTVGSKSITYDKVLGRVPACMHMHVVLFSSEVIYRVNMGPYILSGTDCATIQQIPREKQR
jgi:hypothetical protein